MSDRLVLDLDTYRGALLDALRKGDEAQVDHLIHDFVVSDHGAMPKMDSVRGNNP